MDLTGIMSRTNLHYGENAYAAGKDSSMTTRKDAGKDTGVTTTKDAVKENLLQTAEKQEAEPVVRGSWYTEHKDGLGKVPYSAREKNGTIEYNGVVFVCDEQHNAITLGDTSNSKNVLTVPLENGGSLVVNRDNLGQLADAIGMFSPEDVNRILRAIAADNKARQMQQELEEDENSLGDSADTALEQQDQQVTAQSSNLEEVQEGKEAEEADADALEWDKNPVTQEQINRLFENREGR